MSALDDLASRIRAHLDRFAKDPAIADHEWTDGTGKKHASALYWHPNAYRAGPRVKVRYVSYQYETSLTKADAEQYLAWLDAGNIGRHYELRRSPP